MLGQYEGFFAAGELAFLWRFGLDNRGRCSCGQPLRDCPVWTSIFENAFGGFDAVDAADMVRLRRRFNSRHLPVMISERARQRLLRRLGAFPQVVEGLYQSIERTTGSRIIIDSSKEPHYSYILRTRPALDVYFLHLVRDPRAVALSWQRRKRERGFSAPGFMDQRRPAVSAVYYDVSNAAAEALCPSWMPNTIMIVSPS